MADFEDKTKPHWGVVVDKDGVPQGVHTPFDRCPDDRSHDDEHDGPAMVNSSAFRTGWDSTFGKKEMPN